uniref:CRIB domain-containing protein n=1 Tax=Monopterus albus TaxID=43700 RepID=A0A3Q3IZB5_MONAL
MPLRTSLYRKPSSGRWPSRNSKCRAVLSVNMISLPLADFRHISHIGNNANTDSFRDLSLKMGHSLLLQSSQSEHSLFMACSPPPKPPRLNLNEGAGSASPDWSVGHQHTTSQKRKKHSSMPMLDDEEGEKEMEKEDVYQRGANIATNQTLSQEWRGMNSDREGDATEKTARQQKEEDSGFSFSLNLGPSFLDDVLRVMDKLYN